MEDFSSYISIRYFLDRLAFVVKLAMYCQEFCKFAHDCLYPHLPTYITTIMIGVA